MYTVSVHPLYLNIISDAHSAQNDSSAPDYLVADMNSN